MGLGIIVFPAQQYWVFEKEKGRMRMCEVGRWILTSNFYMVLLYSSWLWLGICLTMQHLATYPWCKSINTLFGPEVPFRAWEIQFSPIQPRTQQEMQSSSVEAVDLLGIHHSCPRNLCLEGWMIRSPPYAFSWTCRVPSKKRRLQVNNPQNALLLVSTRIVLHYYTNSNNNLRPFQVLF